MNENTTSPIFDADEENFADSVVSRSHEQAVLVDISAEWCAPCRSLGPLLERLAEDYAGDFALAVVDADENMRIAGIHKVRGFPTVVAYSRGEEIDRFHGMQGEAFLRRFIDGVLARHAASA